jgi:hypothetical protein
MLLWKTLTNFKFCSGSHMQNVPSFSSLLLVVSVFASLSLVDFLQSAHSTIAGLRNHFRITGEATLCIHSLGWNCRCRVSEEGNWNEFQNWLLFHNKMSCQKYNLTNSILQDQLSTNNIESENLQSCTSWRRPVVRRAQAWQWTPSHSSHGFPSPARE